MAKSATHTVTVLDSGIEEINSLAVLLTTLDKMSTEQRLRIFKYLKSKYSKEWPSESEGY